MWGLCRVSSRLNHGIKIYDGVNIPIIGDLKYDLIISFHVLEHAQNLEGLLSSCFDALTEDGIMIHVLPSPTWRILTTLFWPLGGLAHVLRRLSSKADKTIGGSSETGSKVRWRWLLSRAIPRAHGERGGPITEAYYFSRKFWSEVFAASGFKVIDVTQSHIVYWGNDFIRHGLGLQTRKSLSHIIGSSSNIYIVKKQ